MREPDTKHQKTAVDAGGSFGMGLATAGKLREHGMKAAVLDIQPVFQIKKKRGGTFSRRTFAPRYLRFSF